MSQAPGEHDIIQQRIDALRDDLAEKAELSLPDISPLILVRNEVMAFAQAMEKELLENDHKGGWKKCDPQWLLSRMCDEMVELLDCFEVERTNAPDRIGPREAFLIAQSHLRAAAEALRKHVGTHNTRGLARALSPDEARYSRSRNDGVLSEAADVANFSMMLADVCNKSSPGTKADTKTGGQ